MDGPDSTVEENVQTAWVPIWDSFGSHDENVDCVDDAVARMIDPPRDVALFEKEGPQESTPATVASSPHFFWRFYTVILTTRRDFVEITKSEGRLRVFPV